MVCPHRKTAGNAPGQIWDDRSRWGSTGLVAPNRQLPEKNNTRNLIPRDQIRPETGLDKTRDQRPETGLDKTRDHRPETRLDKTRDQRRG